MSLDKKLCRSQFITSVSNGSFITLILFLLLIVVDAQQRVSATASNTTRSEIQIDVTINKIEEIQRKQQTIAEKIGDIERELEKIKDEKQKSELETQLLNAREIQRKLSFSETLLNKENKLRISIDTLTQEIKKETETSKGDIPKDNKKAQDLVNQLTLLKSEKGLLSGKLDSLYAEMEVKKSQVSNYEKNNILPEDELAKQLYNLNKNILEQEVTVLSLQLDKQTKELELEDKQIDRLDQIVGQIDPKLLVTSEEAIRRKERQTQRLRQIEEKQRDSLVKERKRLQDQNDRVGKEIENKRVILRKSEIDEKSKWLIKTQIDTLLTKQELLKQKEKLVNWQQEFSSVKIDLEKQRIQIASQKTKIPNLRTDKEKLKQLADKIQNTIKDLEKQKSAFDAKANVFQKEIEQTHLMIDHNAIEIEELSDRIEHEPDEMLKSIYDERLTQEELLREKISITEQLKELMDQFMFHFELQKMKWHEIDQLIPASSVNWYKITLLNTDITLFQLLQFFVGIIITLIIAKIFHHFTKTFLAKWFKNESLTEIFERPLRFLVIIIGIYLSTKLLGLRGDLNNFVAKIFDTVIIINVSYMIVKIVDFLVSLLIPVVEKTDTKLDDQLIPIIRKAAKIFIIVISSIILIERLGYPVTSIIAGLGIGGLAFALAAKDTIANLFGSIVIFADRPFQIGDWVIISGSEGVVEEVGVRSTKIRTFADTLITIPNNIVANATIQNISAFRNRRVYLNLGITYDSGPIGAIKAVDIIRTILDENTRVCDGHYIFFDDFKESSLNLMVYYFVNSTVWREYLTVRGDVNTEIMKRFAEAGISFAFPTRTIEFHPNQAPPQVE